MIVKLNPACKDYLWGGTRLKTDFNKSFAGNILAETWELSAHPDGMSTVAEGPDAGITLQALIAKYGLSILGSNCSGSSEFPILVKLIDARDTLSIQVHPDDAYAREHEGGAGKTEMWYIVDCEPGSYLYYGFREEVSLAAYASAIRTGTLTELLNKVEVRPGDVFFIEAGTIHAIGAGIVIAEIQQNSNLTYRVFDYNRRDAQGNTRELHINQALSVTALSKPRTDYDFGGHLVACDYFVTDRVLVAGEHTSSVDTASFEHLLVLEGDGSVIDGGDHSVNFRKGDSLLITAGSGSHRITGNAVLLSTKIP